MIAKFKKRLQQKNYQKKVQVSWGAFVILIEKD